MIRSCYDDEQDQHRINDSSNHECNHAEEATVTPLALQGLQEPGMPEEGTADYQGVGEVQTRHGGELVEVLAVADPYTFRVGLANGVFEGEAFRE